jgi:UDP-GlcNAc:undecaprenyl-phosphate GlcNAc-1-phosphate transferase
VQTIDLNAVWSAGVGLVVTALAVLALRPLAVSLDLIDRPGGRKTHNGEVPVIGGLAMFIGIVVGLGFLRGSANDVLGTLNAAFGLLVLIGIFDDRFSLSPWVRLPVHAVVAWVLIESAGCRITTIGDAFGVGTIAFAGVWTYVTTIVLVGSAINAFNMLDGMDGLAGTTAGVAIAALGYVAWRAGRPELAGISLVLLGAIAGFLIFNMPMPGNRPFRCFMGDAGSTLLGAAVAWLMVQLSQPQAAATAAIQPVTALWLGALPVYELIWSFVRRVSRGRSPFTADAEHFHHLLIKAGFSVRGAFAMFLVLAVLLAVVGLVLDEAGAPPYWSLALLALTGVLVVRSMYRIGDLLKYLPVQARRLKLRR